MLKRVILCPLRLRLRLRLGIGLRRSFTVCIKSERLVIRLVLEVGKGAWPVALGNALSGHFVVYPHQGGAVQVFVGSHFCAFETWMNGDLGEIITSEHEVP